MKVFAVLLAIAMTNNAMATGVHFHSPWHYKGIYLGAKMTRKSIMTQLGVNKFKNNPDINPWKGCNKDAKGDCPFNQYGMRAVEWMDSQIGPYCHDSGIEGPGGFACTDPWIGLTTEGNHGIFQVEVFASRDGTVRAVDISFDSADAEEIFDLAHRQFNGAGVWQNDPTCSVVPMTIVGYSTPHHPKPSTAPLTVHRVCEYLATKHYRVYMTNYDEALSHATQPIYRGVLEMRILDQEL